MRYQLLSEILRKTASLLREAEVDYPAQNIPYYQDRENGPPDNEGGAFGLSEPYIDSLTAPSYEDGRLFPKEYNNQGERPENDADFYTEPYATKKSEPGVPYLTTTVPYQNGESPKDGYKGPGYQEKFTHPQGDPNEDELYPLTEQGGNLSQF